jgi:peptidoglycan glycosyltransferase
MIRFLFILFYSVNAFANFNFSKDLSLKSFDFEDFKEKLSEKAFATDEWPEDVQIKQKKYKVNYTFNEQLTKYIKRELRRYASDYASVVVIDNNTGKVLSAVDYTRETRKFGKKLAFSTSNPAASIFKVITAADLLENTEVSSQTKFTYNGKSTTLYKYQLKDKKTRWTRSQDFKKAFARSNNVIFAKAAIKNTSIQSLFSTANKFGFNEDLMQVIDFGSSILFGAQTDYNLAELASGFNKGTMMSPIHGAVIASIIANDGIMKKPHVVDSVEDEEFERIVWKPSYILSRAISNDTVQQLQDMMEHTVKRGTARGAFRARKTRKIRDIEIGGKTGSITGGLPYGKRDWFVSYAKPKGDAQDKGISICVMIVNVKKWYIKSHYLAKNIIQYYYNSL